jgi:type I restriction enzyme S subunit
MDWPEVTLAQVCGKPQYGAIAKGTAAAVGPKFVRQTDIVSGRIDWKSVPFCDLDQSEFNKYAIQPGDLLISRLGAGVGTAATVREAHNAVFAGYLVRFQADEDRACAEFLGYQLASPHWKNHVEGYRSGAAQPTLNAQQMGAFRFRLPPLVEQRGIAATLGALDDKIESNSRAQRLLEELGSAILECALDLDAYGFPAYDDVRRLGDVLSVLETGSRPRGGASTDGAGMVSLGAESIQSAGVTKTELFKTVPRDYAESMRRGRLEDRDVLVYKDGGRPGNFIPHVSAFGIGFPVREAVINEHVYRVRAADGISQALLYWLLRSYWMDQEMRKRGTGVAIPGLNSGNFRDLPLPAMSAPTAKKLSDQLSPMLDSLLVFGAQNRQLAQLRDTLLPELISGRICAPEAAEAVAEATA